MNQSYEDGADDGDQQDMDFQEGVVHGTQRDSVLLTKSDTLPLAVIGPQYVPDVSGTTLDPTLYLPVEALPPAEESWLVQNTLGVVVKPSSAPAKEDWLVQDTLGVVVKAVDPAVEERRMKWSMKHLSRPSLDKPSITIDPTKVAEMLRLVTDPSALNQETRFVVCFQRRLICHSVLP